MKQFTDRHGNTWDVDLNITAARRVKDLLDCDLLPAKSSDAQGMIKRLLTDRYLLADLLYVICKRQADDRGITDEQFGEALAGDPIDDATQALLGALVDFFPNARDREMAARALEKTDAALAELRSQMESELDQVLEHRHQEAIKNGMKAFRAVGGGSKSNDSPASSASIPDR